MMTNDNYTCQDYRLEMMLLGLKRRLNGDGLTETERADLLKEIRSLEKKLDI